MASITIKGLPADLHGQLKREAEANYRSLNQEIMARLALTFELESAVDRRRDQKWIDEALASGPAAPLTEKEMDAVRDRVLRKKQ